FGDEGVDGRDGDLGAGGLDEPGGRVGEGWEGGDDIGKRFSKRGIEGREESAACIVRSMSDLEMGVVGGLEGVAGAAESVVVGIGGGNLRKEGGIGQRAAGLTETQDEVDGRTENERCVEGAGEGHVAGVEGRVGSAKETEAGGEIGIEGCSALAVGVAG